MLNYIVYIIVPAISALILSIMGWQTKNKIRIALAMLLFLINVLTPVAKQILSEKKEENQEKRIDNLWNQTYSKLSNLNEKKLDSLKSDKNISKRNTASFIAENKKQRLPLTDEKSYIEITTPVEGQVNWRPVVKGIIANPNMQVFLVVHPVGLREYYVQPSISVSNSGTWQVPVYIGREGNIDIGKKYELMAIAAPTEKFTEGQVISEWPDLQNHSKIVTVTRI